MLFLYGEELFNLVPSTDCEDIGIATMRNVLSASWLYQLLTWLPLAFAIASVDQVGYHLGKSELKLLSSKNSVNVCIVFGWVFFTLMSLLTLLLFGRAPISFAMKFAHVGFELMHLIQFFAKWGWSGHALLVFILAIFSFFSTLNMPCYVAHSLTSLGVVLDTANFVLCALVPRKSFAFQLLTTAFLLHATYIWSFVVMVNLSDPTSILLLRSYGVYANSFAIVVGCWSILSTTLHDEYGSIEACQTLIVRKKSNTSMRKQGKETLFLLHDDSVSDLLVPSTETYFPNNRLNTFLMHLLCMSGGVARIEQNQLKWLNFEEANFEEPSAPPPIMPIQRPTLMLLFLYRIVNWFIFIALFHTVTEYTTFLPAVILSWTPFPVFTFVIIVSLYKCVK